MAGPAVFVLQLLMLLPPPAACTPPAAGGGAARGGWAAPQGLPAGHNGGTLERLLPPAAGREN